MRPTSVWLRELRCSVLKSVTSVHLLAC